MAEPEDWSAATWQGSRRRQHQAFLALPFTAKLAVIEELSEVARFFAERRRARGFPLRHGPVFTSLPGAEIVAAGLADLAKERQTVSALAVLVGAPRLRRAGITVPHSPVTDPEHRLYAALAARDSGAAAHSRYNALIRRLVSFERAAECGH